MFRGVRLLGAGMALLAACSGDGSVRATTPTTGATTTVAPATSTTAMTTSSTTTTTVDRLAEIEAIFQDLEQRRLTALYEGDREAFAALFANEAYLERSLEAFDRAEFDGPPLDLDVKVVRLLFDGVSCVAFDAEVDYSSFSDAVPSEGTYVLELSGTWGYSFVGEGWLCDGPHPLHES